MCHPWCSAVVPSLELWWRDLKCTLWQKTAVHRNSMQLWPALLHIRPNAQGITSNGVMCWDQDFHFSLQKYSQYSQLNDSLLGWEQNDWLKPKHVFSNSFAPFEERAFENILNELMRTMKLMIWTVFIKHIILFRQTWRLIDRTTRYPGTEKYYSWVLTHS